MIGPVVVAVVVGFCVAVVLFGCFCLIWRLPQNPGWGDSIASLPEEWLLICCWPSSQAA